MTVRSKYDAGDVRRMASLLAYSEHGASGLSREAAAIWNDDPQPQQPDPEPVPVLPSQPRCPVCQYRRDALGHLKSAKCGARS